MLAHAGLRRPSFCTKQMTWTVGRQAQNSRPGAATCHGCSTGVEPFPAGAVIAWLACPSMRRPARPTQARRGRQGFEKCRAGMCSTCMWRWLWGGIQGHKALHNTLHNVARHNATQQRDSVQRDKVQLDLASKASAAAQYCCSPPGPAADASRQPQAARTVSLLVAFIQPNTVKTKPVCNN